MQGNCYTNFIASVVGPNSIPMFINHSYIFYLYNLLTNDAPDLLLMDGWVIFNYNAHDNRYQFMNDEPTFLAKHGIKIYCSYISHGSHLKIILPVCKSNYSMSLPFSTIGCFILHTIQINVSIIWM